MKIVWSVGLVVWLAAVPVAAQSFGGTHLDPFTVPYGSPPFQYEASRYLLATITTSAEVIAALVPEPLSDMMGTIIKVAVVEHHLVRPIQLDYHEVILSIPVTFDSVQGEFYPILYLDKTDAIIPGREIWGNSKLDADIEIIWSPGGDSVGVTVRRSGTTLIAINAAFGPIGASPPRGGVISGYNVKLIPSAESGGAPDVCQLTHVPMPYSLSDHRTGTGTLTFASIPSDPLAAISIIGSVAMETFYLDLELPFGEVVWDYSTQPGGCDPVLASPFLGDEWAEHHSAHKRSE